MKRLLVTMCVLSLAFVAKESIAQQDPYTANYSSNFQIGDPANSKMILELWKDYDDNAFDRHDYFADTAVMFFPDGSMVRGKDSILARQSHTCEDIRQRKVAMAYLCRR